ncbi:hypothetical protein PUR61_09410 [Streptomyces sp. BE20]|uniref:hypothetical protein n=1 Tax=Streptomyces sp. BE20 TaxID=3002525 RepID=UPI002E794043|nr:hypothetical protein [Streptomyces sp. BE20]MEE1822409.1 hypothetical protein [Streptomyces sp. BE20]
MVRLIPDRTAAIALAGGAVFHLDASDSVGGQTHLELWERTLPFTPAGVPATAPLPPFTLRPGPVSESPTSPTVQAVPLGSIYQLRLFNRGHGSAELAENPQPRRLTLGALDFPSIGRGHATFLTGCGDKPRVMVTPGGTFVSMAFVTQSRTMARVQLLGSTPQTESFGHPVFLAPDVIADAVSPRPAIVHRVSVVDRISAATPGHIPLRTNQELWFTILAWNEAGDYDIVWNTTGLAPATPPEVVRTKQRVVRARLARLHCHEDSDKIGSGSGEFTFGITGGSATAMSPPVSWKPMTTGDMLEVPAGPDLTISPPDAAATVRVWVDGTEDDSGSVPQDDDDRASTADYLGGGPGRGTSLPFPAGQGKELVTDAVLTLASAPVTLGDRFEYSADVVYSVDYV